MNREKFMMDTYKAEYTYIYSTTFHDADVYTIHHGHERHRQQHNGLNLLEFFYF
jgi:hypothetical protein